VKRIEKQKRRSSPHSTQKQPRRQDEMSDTPRGRSWWGVLGWAVWALLLAAWTVALLRPEPPIVGEAFVPTSLRFWAAKGLHLSAYGFLAFLVCWLPTSKRGRLIVWAALLAHAALTEVGQLYVPGRSGSVGDVLINATGLALGVAVGLALRRMKPW
jgi:VanZ family protein